MIFINKREENLFVPHKMEGWNYNDFIVKYICRF